MFDKDTIGKLKKGAYLINNSRGAIADKFAVADAMRSGQLGGKLAFETNKQSNVM